jgi:arginine utilization protein RocB
LNLYHERYEHFCKISGEPCRELAWQPRVMTYEEMEAELFKAHGSEYTAHMVEFKDNLLLDASLDLRMYAARVVEEAWKWMPDQSPAIIVFYSSLYSPRIEVTGETEDELNLIEALEEAVVTVQPEYDEPIVVRSFFPYISDMSFVALSDDDEALDAASRNNPSWGTKFHVDYQEIRELNVPVVNIGPYGLDAHKRYERMELDYSLEIVPNLTNEVIKNVLEK